MIVFQDFYPDGHQGGVTIIQNGVRVLSNGDLRLDPTPGQWQPIPKMGERIVDRDNNEISAKLDDPELGTKFGFDSFVGLTEDQQEEKFHQMTLTEKVNFDVLGFI